MVLSEAGKPTIEAVLAEASAAKLKELAKNYYVKGYSKMNKPALVQAVSAALREPGRMEELLYIIDQPAFLLFRRAAKSRARPFCCAATWTLCPFRRSPAWTSPLRCPAGCTAAATTCTRP